MRIADNATNFCIMVKYLEEGLAGIATISL
ncbi:hypothetical protein W822_15050 [Advenella kashmirensis W13003]|uniref:Uncharacterized protein n=1 Tax=Advenella kashmirensis W13003 TaxID=1424334 RepID=V8QQZ1_9BURK|nr:hypothetical protein W822_15050 [Advenella kashmirensis W13003]